MIDAGEREARGRWCRALRQAIFWDLCAAAIHGEREREARLQLAHDLILACWIYW